MKGLPSLVEQTYRPLEVVIVDDGSTDNTPIVVQEFIRRTESSKEFNVLYLSQSPQGGQRARNAGFRASRGRFVRFLDDDDWLEPDATRIQVAQLEETGADVCYGDWKDVIANHGGIEDYSALCRPRSLSDPIAGLLGDVWFPSFCYLLRREVPERIGGWSESYAALQDRDFINRAAYAGAKFIRAPVIVGCYYHHASVRVSTKNRLAWNECMKRVLLDGIAHLDACSQWTAPRRRAVAESLFAHARRYFDEDRIQFRELLHLMHTIDPAYLAGKTHFRLASQFLGIERAETLRRLLKRLLGITK